MSSDSKKKPERRWDGGLALALIIVCLAFVAALMLASMPHGA